MTTRSLGHGLGGQDHGDQAQEEEKIEKNKSSRRSRKMYNLIGLLV